MGLLEKSILVAVKRGYNSASQLLTLFPRLDLSEIEGVLRKLENEELLLGKRGFLSRRPSYKLSEKGEKLFPKIVDELKSIAKVASRSKEKLSMIDDRIIGEKDDPQLYQLYLILPVLYELGFIDYSLLSNEQRKAYYEIEEEYFSEEKASVGAVDFDRYEDHEDEENFEEQESEDGE